MPLEYVRLTLPDRRTTGSAPDNADGSPADPPRSLALPEMTSARIDVGWNKAGDGWVQVGIPLRTRFFDSDSQDRFYAGLAREVLGSFAGNPVPEDIVRATAQWVFGQTGETAFSEPMERAEVNALIRLLRKARDGAFGRDE